MKLVRAIVGFLRNWRILKQTLKQLERFGSKFDRTEQIAIEAFDQIKTLLKNTGDIVLSLVKAFTFIILFCLCI
ncbi:uncharacterized protein MONOS_3555 [Monocercomonoides exilis]|uniref:uncharacterized protein n=1 Tax=Monocercomonoides exilis TaxID=2049356 RepID=UPI003559DAD3|nr:hypothetical protein MONOS_3555 [Monocercomonoides exilis]|eukprot:MONOS_3555.1-p1 / transcript=MONOS_3555.1 / gene=MONOS_3555 / organism=Monocercomonoides_exilis_PA203 / gene_product=unspecified product / transcript_product=unspecified product / location=Mono_scaffold00084:90257-91026(+) / protein_length=74 / sequence_SO=supercontig / SO=protein_coding / is_pseudo=false